MKQTTIKKTRVSFGRLGLGMSASALVIQALAFGVFSSDVHAMDPKVKEKYEACLKRSGHAPVVARETADQAVHAGDKGVARTVSFFNRVGATGGAAAVKTIADEMHTARTSAAGYAQATRHARNAAPYSLGAARKLAADYMDDGDFAAFLEARTFLNKALGQKESMDEIPGDQQALVSYILRVKGQFGGISEKALFEAFRHHDQVIGEINPGSRRFDADAVHENVHALARFFAAGKIDPDLLDAHALEAFKEADAETQGKMTQLAVAGIHPVNADEYDLAFDAAQGMGFKRLDRDVLEFFRGELTRAEAGEEPTFSQENLSVIAKYFNAGVSFRRLQNQDALRVADLLPFETAVVALKHDILENTLFAQGADRTLGHFFEILARGGAESKVRGLSEAQKRLRDLRQAIVDFDKVSESERQTFEQQVAEVRETGEEARDRDVERQIQRMERQFNRTQAAREQERIALGENADEALELVTRLSARVDQRAIGQQVQAQIEAVFGNLNTLTRASGQITAITTALEEDPTSRQAPRLRETLGQLQEAVTEMSAALSKAFAPGVEAFSNAVATLKSLEVSEDRISFAVIQHFFEVQDNPMELNRFVTDLKAEAEGEEEERSNEGSQHGGEAAEGEDEDAHAMVATLHIADREEDAHAAYEASQDHEMRLPRAHDEEYRPAPHRGAHVAPHGRGMPRGGAYAAPRGGHVRRGHRA